MATTVKTQTTTTTQGDGTTIVKVVTTTESPDGTTVVKEETTTTKPDGCKMVSTRTTTTKRCAGGGGGGTCPAAIAAGQCPGAAPGGGGGRGGEQPFAPSSPPSSPAGSGAAAARACRTGRQQRRRSSKKLGVLRHLPEDWAADDVAKKPLDGASTFWILCKKDPYVLAAYNGNPTVMLTVRLQAKQHQRMPLPEVPPREPWGEEGDFLIAQIYPMEVLPLVTLQEQVAPQMYAMYMQGQHCMGFGMASGSVGPAYTKWIKDNVEQHLRDKVAAAKVVAKDLGFPDEIPRPNTKQYHEEGWEEKMLKFQKACQERKVDYVDLSFEPGPSALGGASGGQAVWQMPNTADKRGFLDEPVARPAAQTFVGEGGGSGRAKDVSPNDIDQGSLGDCYFVSSIAAITERPQELVLPMFDPKADGENNCWAVVLGLGGMYKKYSVDGYLPVSMSAGQRNPIYARNRDQPNEMWVTMLEKTYARLHGSYQNIVGGCPSQALSDLTGFPGVAICGGDWQKLKADPDLLFRVLEHHDQMGHLLYVSTGGCEAGGVHKQLGLANNHAYTCMACKRWKDDKLLKIRNPWGTAVEWTGKYGDSDPCWQAGDAEQLKQALALPAADGSMIPYEPMTGDEGDGTWWMTVEDLVKYFDSCGMCYAHPDWWDVRWRADMNAGWQPVVLEGTVTEETKVLMWVKQPTGRGVEDWPERTTLCPLQPSVLRKGDGGVESVATSGFTQSPNAVLAFPSDAQLPREYAVLKPGTYYFAVRSVPTGNKQEVAAGVLSNKPINMRPIKVTDGMKKGGMGFGALLSEEHVTADGKLEAQLNRVDVTAADLANVKAVKAPSGKLAEPCWWKVDEI